MAKIREEVDNDLEIAFIGSEEEAVNQKVEIETVVEIEP